MDKFLALFSFRGRTNRARYWLTVVLNYLFFMCVSFALLGATIAVPAVGLFWLVLVAPAFVISFAVVVRRLHDRNKPGWWAVPMVVPSLVFSGLGAILSSVDPNDPLASVVSLVGLPFSIWALVELGCLKGTAGPNRFGSDPLSPAPGEVFA